MSDFLIIGKFIGAHGVRGECKIFPITDDVRRFLSLKKAVITDDSGKKIRDIQVKSARVVQDRVLLYVEGIADRDASETLHGKFIAVSKEDRAKLPKGRYYISDLLGCRVLDENQAELGTIADIFPTGANDVIAVRRQGKPDLLIPYLNSIVELVDIELRQMSVRLPDGLLEIYEP